MPEVYLALGSNMGDREAYLIKALQLLQNTRALTFSGFSGIYQTAPVGYVEQAPFLNMVCRGDLALTGDLALAGESALDPFALLDTLLEVENALERKRVIRWGPRTIDLDLLLYGGEKITTPRLTVPHPRMFERAFVLTPLRDVYPFAEIEGRSFAERIGACSDREGITLYRPARAVEDAVKRRLP